MSAAPLPAVERWLSALIPRVRALRVAHGAARLVAAALGAASFILLLDAGFALPAWVRGLFLSVWLTAVGVLVWRWVLIPWRGALPLSEVAHEVGKRWPELGERLRLAVAGPTAAQAADAANLLSAIDGAEAVPVRPVVGFASGAALVLAAVVATAVLVPGSVERLRRVAAPWAKNGAHAFRVVVTSGEPVVRRGGPVTLSAYAERVSSAPAAPPEAVVATRDTPDGPETRTPMAADGATFHITRAAVSADFEYRVEVGAARSEWFRVTALDAVDLGPGTAIEIAPPEYATGVPRRTLPALGDFAALQYGSASFRLAFTQPAATGHLDWRASGEAKSELVALEFAADGMSATARLPLRSDGVLRLILVREAGGNRLRTDTVATVRARPDAPPRFEQLSGATAKPRTVTPGARVPITFVAVDDLGVAAASLQYVTGPDESKSVSVPIPLTGAGTPRASGRIDFDLAGTAREGDVVRFRVVASDGRSVDSERLGAQAVTFPRAGWSELRIAATAPPLIEQDIACARDALADALTAARKELKEAADEAAAVQTASAGSDALPLDLVSRLGHAREKVRATRDTLHGAAGDAALNPDARPLATAVCGVGSTLTAAEDSLRRGETDLPAVRADALKAAAELLRDADAKLSELGPHNRRFARARLDRLALSALAADQAALAGGKPGPDFAACQRALLDRLTALLAESDALRAAHDGAKANELRKLAAELAELTAHVRDLDAAANQTAADARAALVAAVAREQGAVIKLAGARFARIGTAARLAGAAPLPPADLDRVAKLVAAGNVLDALTAIERHAQAAGQLADAFEKSAAERADPKLAARHFALWQNDLLDRFRAAARAGGFAALPDEAQASLRGEQKALASAVAALALPPDESVRTAHADARRHTELAGDFLARGGAGAEDAMKAAARALDLVFERAPPLGERSNKSRGELEKLRADFEAHANAVDKLLRTFERQPEALAQRLVALADGPRKFAAAVAALDLPGHAARQARVAAALRAAATDLQDALPLDASASQLRARSELERLRVALDGATPPDAKADELYRRLTATADLLDANGPTAEALPAAQDAGRQLAPVSAPDAQVLLNDARVAVQAAETALRDGKPEAACRVRAAAGALGRLCDRLSGAESDWARVKRLAALRRAAAANPKELLTSDEAVRQLGREFEELTRTRVGPGGQVFKKRALDLYTKLRAKADPDRVGTDLKALAAALDELAPKVAEVAELAAGGAREAPLAPASDEYLPSKPQADALRELEKRLRLLHAQVAGLPAEHASRLRPSANNPLANLESTQSAIARDALPLAKEFGSEAAKTAATAAAIAADRIRVGRIGLAKAEADHAANFFRQVATALGGKPAAAARAATLAVRQDAVRAELAARLDRADLAAAQQVGRAAELGRGATEFAARLGREAESFDAAGPAHKSLVAAAVAVREAEKRLAEAARKQSDGAAMDAKAVRTAALESLGTAADAIGSPAGAMIAPGDALRAAERAMRRAITDPGAARSAAEALERAKRD